MGQNAKAAIKTTAASQETNEEKSGSAWCRLRRATAAKDRSNLALLLLLVLLRIRRDVNPRLVRQRLPIPEHLEVGLVECLALEQCLGDDLDPVFLFGEQRAYLRILLVDDRSDLLVDLARRLLGVVLAARVVVTTEEDGSLTCSSAPTS